MEVTVYNVQGQRIVEGVPDQPIMQHVADVVTVLETCFGNQARRLLLYDTNLTPQFFDIRSGEAGEILQKLRNYEIRLAIVRSPTQRLSRRFDELLVDEQRGPYFRMFDDRSAAEQWLCSG